MPKARLLRFQGIGSQFAWKGRLWKCRIDQRRFIVDQGALEKVLARPGLPTACKQRNSLLVRPNEKEHHLIVVLFGNRDAHVNIFDFDIFVDPNARRDLLFVMDDLGIFADETDGPFGNRRRVAFLR